MNMARYEQTLIGKSNEVRTMRLVVAIVLAINVVLAIALLRRDVTVHLAPVPLEAQATVSSASASEQMQVSWAVYLTTLLGNVTPQNAEFVSKSLAANLSPNHSQTMLDSVAAQVRTIQEEQIALTFRPNVARYDGETRKVVVSGELVTTGLRGEQQRELRTYEMRFIVQNYRVLLDDIRVYKGNYRRQASDA